MKPQAYWQQAERPHFSALRKPAEFDVVVIGGGITGVSTAYQLKRAGKRVCLLERDRLGFVDTGLTTAHLTAVTDLRISALAKNFGDEAAALVLNAGATAIDMIESIAAREGIDCEFRRVPGYLFSCKHDGSEADELQAEARLADRLGLPATFLPSIPYFNRPGIQFADQAKFHPLKYIAGLARQIDGEGSSIHEQSAVEEVLEDPRRVVVNGQVVRCDFVVVATHDPLTGKSGFLKATLLQTKIYPYLSYVIGATAPQGTVPEACYWDTANPYHYLRVESGDAGDYLIFGGEDHKTGQESDNAERFENLARTLREWAPSAQPDRQWSGQVIETNDGLPYIGETSPSQFVATGFAGNGMTFGTLAGQMACDAVMKRPNPWQKVFAVDRKSIRGGAWDYLVENIDYPWHFIKDRLAGADGRSEREIQRGEGAVLNLDGERVACSRDEDDTLHTHSAYCTHMGCLVRWNNAEHTWDCPCHGSRFRPDGKVLAGPAESDLANASTESVAH